MGEAVAASSPDVLLVEDEALVGLMIEVALTEAGFSVHTFSNGRDALAYLAAGGRADVLFTDIDTAGDVEGVELARRIRALRAGVAVVCATGRRVPAQALHPRPGLRGGGTDGGAASRRVRPRRAVGLCATAVRLRAAPRPFQRDRDRRRDGP
jgi:CheY-like chemotaxis protein